MDLRVIIGEIRHYIDRGYTFVVIVIYVSQWILNFSNEITKIIINYHKERIPTFT